MLVLNLIGHTNIITHLEVLSEKLLVSSSDDTTIKIWNTETGEMIRNLVGHTQIVNHLKLLPNGDLASAADDSLVKIWNFSSGHK